MTRVCGGCQARLPAGYMECSGDNKHASELAVAEAIAILSKLTRVDRKRALQKFCRECSRMIECPDWSGRNFCTECSPDPLE